MSGSALVVVCVFAIIGIFTCIFSLFHIVELFCNNYDKFKLLYGQYERISDTLKGLHEIVELQQDEIKLLKERIDIYEKSNNEED